MEKWKKGRGVMSPQALDMIVFKNFLIPRQKGQTMNTGCGDDDAVSGVFVKRSRQIAGVGGDGWSQVNDRDSGFFDGA